MRASRVRPVRRTTVRSVVRRAARPGLAAFVLAVQLPAVATIATLSGQPLAAIAPAALLSWAFISSTSGMYRLEPRSKAHLYLGLWPFFAWWTACLLFAALAPAALLVDWIFGTKVALAVAGGASVVTGAAAVRRTPRSERIEVELAGLPAELDGYRIAQLTDIHCGAFAPEARVADWVRRVNELGADLIAVTGDLVTHGTAYVPAVGRALSGLSAPDGVWACMGNHDYFGAGEALLAAQQAAGIRVLRNQWVRVRPGLCLAGVDDTWTRRDDVARSLSGIPDNEASVLLAHDPALFDEAAAAGAWLTLSGHTHGGQLAIPLVPRWNLARLVSRYTVGLYRKGRSLLYVSRGAGTTGPPIRVGAPAEITLITLRRAPGGPASPTA